MGVDVQDVERRQEPDPKLESAAEATNEDMGIPRMQHYKHAVAAIGCAAIVVISVTCGATDPGRQTPTPPSTIASPTTITPTGGATATADPPAPSPTAPLATAPPATEPAPVNIPAGFPLEPQAMTDLVVGASGARTFILGAGGPVRDVSAMRHPSDDGAYANAAGWNCRVHVEYEGAPAVDWYVQPGTPVYATMDGAAILIVNTTANSFDYYALDREPYIGDPDRARAPISPFPGPSGGMGLYVAVSGDEYRTDYGHLDVAATTRAVPATAFAAPYSQGFDYAAAFATPRSSIEGTQLATWPVRRGDLLGYTGDTGYSEAPHLHYEITRLRDGAQLCPTTEPGFADGGWLGR